MAITDSFGGVMPNLGADPATAGLVFVMVIIGGLLLLACLFFFIYVKKFNVRVDVEERRGNNVVEYTTRGGIIENKKTGVKEFRVWRGQWNPFNPLKTAPPPNDVYRIDRQGSPVLRVFKDSVDTFKIQKPAKPQDLRKKNGDNHSEVTYLEPANTADMPEPVDVEWFSWASQTLQSLAPRYRNDEGWWKENKDIVSFMAVLFVFLAGSIFMWNFWTDMSGNLASVSEDTKEGLQSQERVAELLAGVESVEPARGNSGSNQSRDDRGGSGNFIERIATDQGGED